MNCARCGEEITAPYYFDGKYYGWTCIKLVNPSAKKAHKESVVLADSFTIEQITATKRLVIATYQGKRYKDFIFSDIKGLMTLIDDKLYLDTRFIR